MEQDSHHRIAYRAFAVNDRGRLSGVPDIIMASDDGDAVRQVSTLGHPLCTELWEGTRLVARVPLARVPR